MLKVCDANEVAHSFLVRTKIKNPLPEKWVCIKMLSQNINNGNDQP